MPLEEREWTIMFYFASDNPLAPEIVTQIKAIRQGGFHPEAHVVAHFDPHTENASTHIFDINRINKLKARDDARKRLEKLETSEEFAALPEDVKARRKARAAIDYQIGYLGFRANDPYVWNVMEDKIWGEEKDVKGTLIRERIKNDRVPQGQPFHQPELPKRDNAPAPAERSGATGPTATGPTAAATVDGDAETDDAGTDDASELSPSASLKRFLRFCSDNYPARHYMLFILGHGVVVGNDIFLYDEHAEQPSLTLKALGELLKKFGDDIKAKVPKAQFELVGFHSCSMSSLEVAYELQGKANFMLASQGPAFVGSWPYRNIMVRVFNDLKDPDIDFNHPEEGRSRVKEMLSRISAYCHFNSYDFLVAGYSFDLCLCDLNSMAKVKEQIPLLSSALTKVLKSDDPWAKERIILAHWDAQSYWQESYTDLYDFCACLQRRLSGKLVEVYEACENMMNALEKEGEMSDDWREEPKEGGPPKDGRFIVRSGFTGPASQYSNGMSVFFPWSEPLRAEFMQQYQDYAFVQEHKKDSWLDFLSAYFEQTMRKPRAEERGKQTDEPSLEEAMVEEFAFLGVSEAGPLNVSSALGNDKPGSSSGIGDDYRAPSLKNHPPFLRKRPPKGAKPNGDKPRPRR